jgi:hypothetical protein
VLALQREKRAKSRAVHRCKALSNSHHGLLNTGRGANALPAGRGEIHLWYPEIARTRNDSSRECPGAAIRLALCYPVLWP